MKALREAKRSDFQGQYNERIVVVDENLNEFDSVRRNLRFGDYGAGIFVRYKNNQYRVQRYGNLNVIVVRSDAPNKSFRTFKRGTMSAACKGARY